MKYSVTIVGIFAAILVPVLGQIGFSEGCSQEIMGVGIPTLLSLPGLVMAYVGRLRQGDVTLSGIKKA